MNAISAAPDSQAQLRARQTQIRNTHLNSELNAIQEQASIEARNRRSAEIKSLLAENDALSALSHEARARTLGLRSSLSHEAHERNIRTVSSIAHEAAHDKIHLGFKIKSVAI
uniref:Uncharacterized protein n=1 Tax=Cacopsylla melanoneura TaxID=428564 RepID=A0A8D8UHW6_9HEMI